MTIDLSVPRPDTSEAFGVAVEEHMPAGVNAPLSQTDETAARRGLQGLRGNSPPGRQRAAAALAVMPASAVLALRVVLFFTSLYVLYSLTIILSSTRPGNRDSLLARLAARTRYALWLLEQRANSERP